MHRALLIPEVRSHILDYLVTERRISATPEHGRLGRALVALARTCHALSEPALDAFWYELRTLSPLLYCSRAKSRDGSVIVEDGEILSPPFNDVEWNVVLRYAPRVRELCLMGSDKLSIKILQSVWSRTTLLFSNLLKLSWNYNTSENLTLIRLVLSPSLRNLEVRLHSVKKNSVLGFLECYHAVCPNLRSFLFSYTLDPTSPELITISRAVCRVPDLESLTCYEINEHAFLHFAQSRNIKKFSAHLFKQSEDLRRLAGCFTPECVPFENLRILDLALKDFSIILPFLRSRHQPLEKVSFYFTNIPPPEAFHELFIALDSPTRRQTLRQISLFAGTSAQRSISPVTFEVLSPLLVFSLHTLEVNLMNSILLNDDELVRLVRGWPDLKVLQLTNRIRRRPSHCPTLKGLLHALVRCPELWHVSLCLDVRAISSLTEEESRICNQLVKALANADSLIGKSVVAGFSQFLLDEFSPLDDIGLYSGSVSHRCDDTWRVVDIGYRHEGPSWRVEVLDLSSK